MKQVSPANPEIVDQIQENLIAYFRIYAGLPGSTFVENAHVTWNAGPPGSMVLRARLSPERLDEQIDAIIDQMGQTTTLIDWFVFPSCQPVDLGERVAARWLAGGPDGAWTLIGKIGRPGGTWLLADLTALPPAPAVAAPLQVVPVENLQTLQIWRQCSAAGFGSAISWAMLQEAKKRGYTQAYVWSSNWGRNVYRNVGFVPIEMGMREYEWQRKGAAHDDRNSLPTTLPVYGYCHGDTCAYNCW